jgi:hypothetical protein
MRPSLLTTLQKDDSPPAPRGLVKGRLIPLLIVLAGIVIGQVILYGPSFAGRKVLLPLDILTDEGVYVPMTPQTLKVRTHNVLLSDVIYVSEPSRRFAAAELHAGRLPMWAPNQYGGAPFIWPKFSPFHLLKCCTPSPGVLPYAELLAAVIAGLGAWCFCRQALGVAFWPAVICAWCYPLTAFFVLWQGFNTAVPVLWLPWLLLAVHQAVRGSRMALPGLSLVTALVLTSGQLDVGGQVLLSSGLYAVWCVVDVYRKEWQAWRVGRVCLALAVGWGLGFMLAAPYLLPVLEYTRTGARITQRSRGVEERPPIGLAALPQVVLPRAYGASEAGSLPMFPQGQRNLPESSGAAYAGVLATLFLAPLAWCSRRHRFANLFWVFLGFLGLSWSLNVPLVVHLLRLPGLNLMSHNRFVFAAAFAILALAAVGLDALWRGSVQWRGWFWLPTALLALLCLWSLHRALMLPDAMRAGFAPAAARGDMAPWVFDMDELHRAANWYARNSLAGAGWCVIAIAAWLVLFCRVAWRPWFGLALGLLLPAELIWFGAGRAAQCDPSLYFPRVPALDEILHAAPGRIIGSNALPANLATLCGLRDIRGYDAVDPARLIELMATTADKDSTIAEYGFTQYLSPRMTVAPDGQVRLPPLLDMLGVRYVIFRGEPPPGTRPVFQSTDYWVLVNSNALPRAFVPRRVEMVAEAKARLAKLTAEGFDPREVVCVEAPVALPDACRGTAQIVEEIPTRVKVSVRMETAGLVVLTDLWDNGWQAYLDGKRMPVLRANHAVRGVVVPAGSGTLEFRYAPASFAWGLGLAGLAGIVLVGWVGVVFQLRSGSCVNPEAEGRSARTPLAAEEPPVKALSAFRARRAISPPGRGSQ